MKNQSKFYQDLWQNEIDNVIGEDYQNYATKFSEKPKIQLIENYLSTIPEKQSVLEIGCGSGRILSHFKNQFGIQKGYGIDISDKAISFASAHHKYCSFSVLNIDENDLPYKDSEIDIVLLCDIVEHVADVNHLLLEAMRVGKHVVIKVPLEKTLLEYVNTLCGRDTSINERHRLGHIQSFSLGFFREYFRKIAQEIPIQVEMINVKQFTQRRYWILSAIGHLLYHTPFYRFVFPTELGIHIQRAERS